jgi:gamma-glutamyl-gamma-aminobutyrate hydrolase PuuD
MKISRFNEAVVKLLSEKLKKFNDKTLDLVLCTEVFSIIFNTLVEVFETAGTGLTNEAMNYLAQQYYDGVVINGNQELDPNIFTQRAKVENIETRELALLAVMLNGTDFAIPLIHEIKKRS